MGLARLVHKAGRRRSQIDVEVQPVKACPCWNDASWLDPAGAGVASGAVTVSGPGSAGLLGLGPAKPPRRVREARQNNSRSQVHDEKSRKQHPRGRKPTEQYRVGRPVLGHARSGHGEGDKRVHRRGRAPRDTGHRRLESPCSDPGQNRRHHRRRRIRHPERATIEVLSEVREGKIQFSKALEDIHLNVESRLKDISSSASPPAVSHTARSSTTRSPVDFRLWVECRVWRTRRDQLTAADGKPCSRRPKRMPTPSCRASLTCRPPSPSRSATTSMAYVEMFDRDRGRFADAIIADERKPARRRRPRRHRASHRPLR